MSADDPAACVNFRGVGRAVNALIGRGLLRERTLFRCGKLDSVSDLEQIGRPRTIVNLRWQREARRLDVK